MPPALPRKQEMSGFLTVRLAKPAVKQLRGELHTVAMLEAPLWDSAPPALPRTSSIFAPLRA